MRAGLEWWQWAVGEQFPRAIRCQSSNDAANSGGAPIPFAGNVDGTCGATDATTTDNANANANGTVTCLFPSAVLGTAGCTVALDVIVDDYGSAATLFNPGCLFSWGSVLVLGAAAGAVWRPGEDSNLRPAP